MVTDIRHLVNLFKDSTNYDDILFLTQLTLGFDQLLQLAELCISDDKRLWDCRKLMMHFDVKCLSHSIALLLPGHKADKFFRGSQLLVLNSHSNISPYPWILKYLALRDAQYPWHPELWLWHNGTSPNRSWFTARLHHHFGNNISGHLMRAGGATALAAAGVPDDRIQILGCWSSDAYQLYIHQHSVVLLFQLSSNH